MFCLQQLGDLLRPAGPSAPDALPIRLLLCNNRCSTEPLSRWQLLPVYQNDVANCLSCRIVLPNSRNCNPDCVPLWQLLSNFQFELAKCVSCGDISANASCHIGIRLHVLHRRQLLPNIQYDVAIAVCRRQLLPVQQHDGSHIVPCWKLVSQHQHDVTLPLFPSRNLLSSQRHVGPDHLPLWKLLPKRRNRPHSLLCGHISANASCHIGIRLHVLHRRQLLSHWLPPQCFMPSRYIHILIQPYSTVAMLGMSSRVFRPVWSLRVCQMRRR